MVAWKQIPSQDASCIIPTRLPHIWGLQVLCKGDQSDGKSHHLCLSAKPSMLLCKEQLKPVSDIRLGADASLPVVAVRSICCAAIEETFVFDLICQQSHRFYAIQR